MKKITPIFDAEVSVEQMASVAQLLSEYVQQVNTVITLEGQLGAGKTTLTRELLRIFGVQEPIVSPTFNYMQAYTSSTGKRIYHFDLYRLPSLDDFLAAGFDEYVYAPNSITLIEWPAIIEPLLTNYLEVTLSIASAAETLSKRQIVIQEITQ